MPPWTCTIFILSKYVVTFLGLGALLSYQVIRILHFTAWRNTIDLNDRLIIVMFHTVTLGLSLEFTGWIYLLDDHKTLRLQLVIFANLSYSMLARIGIKGYEVDSRTKDNNLITRQLCLQSSKTFCSLTP